jgi:hypothetical protein
MSTITREQAAQIAADVLRFKSDSDTLKVGKVVTLEEITWAGPYPSYGTSRDIFDNAWIVYVHPKEILGLMSSTIMVISRETGHVIYFGSANDEG